MYAKETYYNVSGVVETALAGLRVSYEETSLRNILYLFPSTAMILGPVNARYSRIEEVPNFYYKIVSVTVIVLTIEFLISASKGITFGRRFSFENGYTNFQCNAYKLLSEILTRSCELKLFSYLYDNHAIYPLPWDHPLTWIFGALVMDLAYYWAHRIQHEVSVLWGVHQDHHSSDYLNLTVSFRQSALSQMVLAFFAMPFAVLVPPGVMAAHLVLCFVFQFWLHSEIIYPFVLATIYQIHKLSPDIPIASFFLTMPSHHRVHHGRNAYCIDKNYAAVFIFWDRLFGTFEEESKIEETVYGVTEDDGGSFDQYEINVKPIIDPFFKLPSSASFTDKIKGVIYGPAWRPGLPRLGSGESHDISNEPPVRHHRTCSYPMRAYACYSFAQAFFLLFSLLQKVQKYQIVGSELQFYLMCLNYALCPYSSGLLLDGKSHAYAVEALRYTMLEITHLTTGMGLAHESIYCHIFFMSNALAWIVVAMTKSPERTPDSQDRPLWKPCT